MKHIPQSCELWFEKNYLPSKALPTDTPDLYELLDGYGYFVGYVPAWKIRKFHDPKSDWSIAHNEKVAPLLATKNLPFEERPNLQQIEQMYKELV